MVMDDPHLAKMFKITGFDGMFVIYKTLSEAISPASPRSFD